MKYAIDYRSMHTAIHGLLLFDEKDTAQACLEVLKVEDEVTEQDVGCILETCTAQIKEVNYRLLQETMDRYDDGKEVYNHKFTIINYNQSVDSYFL